MALRTVVARTGGGAVFKVTPSGTETVLYSFGSQSVDGLYPHEGGFDQRGNLDGTTLIGGGKAGYSRKKSEHLQFLQNALDPTIQYISAISLHSSSQTVQLQQSIGFITSNPTLSLTGRSSHDA